MNTSLRLRRSFLAAVALCTVSASALFASQPALERLVPTDTALAIAWRDLPAMQSRLADSSFGRAWADPEIARFLAPLQQHPKVVEFLSKLKAETDLSFSEFSALMTGDMLIAVPKIDFTKQEPPALLMALDVGENQARLTELLSTSWTNRGATLVRDDYNGVEIVSAAPAAKDGEGEPATTSFWAFHEGRWFFGTSRAAVTDALDALAAGGLSSSLAESPDYLRLIDRAQGKPELLAHFNFRAIYPAFLASIEAQRDPNAAPNMFGIEPASVMKALGLDAIDGFSVVSSHRDDTDYFTMTLNYAEDRGLVRLLAYKDGPVAKPDWMPAAWFNVSTQNFSVADFYNELEVLFARVSPLFAGMAQGQVKAFERKLGIDLKRDLFGSLGTSFVSGFSDPAGVGADKATPYDELDQFIGVSLADAGAFERTLDAIKGAFLPPGDASPLQAREYLDRTIYSFTPPMPGAKGVAYTISDGWLMIGVGSAGTVESAIQLQATPNSDLAFWRRADVRAATDAAPSGAVSLQYTELAPIFASLASFIVKLQEDGDADERFVDASALPSREVFARYFKHATAHSLRTSDGLVIHSEGPAK